MAGQVEDGSIDGRELGIVDLAAVNVLLDPGDDEELCEPLGSGVGTGLDRHGRATLHMEPAGRVVQVDGNSEGVGGGDNGEV